MLINQTVLKSAQIRPVQALIFLYYYNLLHFYPILPSITYMKFHGERVLFLIRISQNL